MIVIVDFTGKAEFYNRGLINGINSAGFSNVKMISPLYKKGLNYLNKSPFRRLLMPLIIVGYYLKWFFSRDIKTIHWQWLPFEAIKGDLFWIWLLKKTKHCILTVHNVLPHDSGTKYINYNRKVYSQFDRIITHDKNAAFQLSSNFNIETKKIKVIDIGVEFPKKINSNWSKRKQQLIIFGHIKRYKGVVEFLENFSNVINDLDFSLRVIGRIHPSVKIDLDRVMNNVTGKIYIEDRFISDLELSTLLNESKYCVFPYLEITGSAAFLTAIAHGCIPLSSDLPLFQSYYNELGFPLVFSDNTDLKNQLSLSNNSGQELSKMIFNKAKNRFCWDSIGLKYSQFYSYFD